MSVRSDETVLPETPSKKVLINGVLANIFGNRNQLRAKGIRVSNELTKFQGQKLKELSKRGIIGYYRNGVLYQRDAKQYPSNRTYVHA